MSIDPSSIDYLDAIFATIRAFNQMLAEARQWLNHAEQARQALWALQFLKAARASTEQAHARLEELEERLRGLGPVDEIPAPLDQLVRNAAGMRAEIQGQDLRLLEVEAAIMSRPIGLS